MRTFVFRRARIAVDYLEPLLWGSRPFVVATLEAADEERLAGRQDLADRLVDQARTMRAA